MNCFTPFQKNQSFQFHEPKPIHFSSRASQNPSYKKLCFHEPQAPFHALQFPLSNKNSFKFHEYKPIIR